MAEKDKKLFRKTNYMEGKQNSCWCLVTITTTMGEAVAKWSAYSSDGREVLRT